MTGQRGLTLIEVVVSLVLLTLLTTSTMPLLREFVALGRERPSEIDLIDLSELADAFLTDPADFGIEELPDEAALAWPEGRQGPPVTLRMLRAGGEPSDHHWLLFESQGLTVLRWQRVEAELSPETEAPEAIEEQG